MTLVSLAPSLVEEEKVSERETCVRVFMSIQKGVKVNKGLFFFLPLQLLICPFFFCFFWLFLSSNRSQDPNVNPPGLCPGRGPAVCDGQASGACGGSLLCGFKLVLPELCMDQPVKCPAMV